MAKKINKRRYNPLGKCHICGQRFKTAEEREAEEREARDVFTLSDGNLTVLENIPKMMLDNKFRQQLRLLTINFLYRKKGGCKRTWTKK